MMYGNQVFAVLLLLALKMYFLGYDRCLLVTERARLINFSWSKIFSWPYFTQYGLSILGIASGGNQTKESLTIGCVMLPCCSLDRYLLLDSIH
jgi:hypothetical protein